MSSVFHRSRGSRKPAETVCIFVHAGAGYHSVQNEAIHLQACNDAATAGMSVLRSGGSAVEAVEMAIRVLEDREITNAGYGSNLAIDGVVEGDAIMVDHFGRSGACGAVSQIKNPISLARLVLDLSTQELTLRRVPPNMLVGQGATDFAFEQGMPVLPHDALISPAARERWAKWSHDLKHADKRARRQQASNHAPTPIEPPPGYEQLATKPGQPDQDKSLATGVWNEGQPVSPPSSTPVTPSNPAVAHLAHPLASSGSSPISRTSSSSSHLTKATPATSASDAEGSPLQPLTAANLARNHRMRTREEQSYESSTTYRPDTDPQDASRDLEVYFATRYPQANSNSSEIDDGEDMDLDDSEAQYEQNGHQPNACGDAYHDVRSMTDEEDGAESSGSTLKLPSLSPSPPPPNPLHSATTVAKVEHQACREDTSRYHFQNVKESSADSAGPSCKPASGGHNAGVQSQDPDLITDTVGAIAIDSEGNVAAGASSGGIGMKFRGRVGPAALVGVGAAVTPPDGEDRTKTCTAAVTSGTGEHMGTTLAASTCAERLYTNRRKRKGGGYEPCEDDQAVRGMIEHDFMEHPSVKQSHSAGAIGVLAVKRTAHGAYLYFAHNTDSFALASMSADDPKPTCTMSRSHGNGMLAQGGRAIRYKKKW